MRLRRVELSQFVVYLTGETENWIQCIVYAIWYGTLSNSWYKKEEEMKDYYYYYYHISYYIIWKKRKRERYINLGTVRRDFC